MTPLMLSASSGNGYTPHPQGQYPAVCVDVVDHGWVETGFGPKPKVRLVFATSESGERTTDGQARRFPLTVSGYFTASLHEKANLRSFLEGWRGSPFTSAELQGFDLEKMIGAPAFLQVTHNHANGKVYANIDSVMRLPQGMSAPEAPRDYVRVCERDDWAGPAPHADLQSGTEDDDDPLPF